MNSNPPLSAVFTLVAWFSCLCVGAVGLLMPNADWQPPPVTRATRTQLIDVVELTRGEAQSRARPAPGALPTLAVPSPPAPLPAPLADAPPALTEIVQPAAVQPRFMAPLMTPPMARQAQSASAVPPLPRQITLGQGEGERIEPRYPYEARIERQEGLVLIRFTVGADREVVSATVVQPCPFPLLNEEALRAVRDGGPFSPGLYEIRIRFALRRG